jgi:hypothetical protein
MANLDEMPQELDRAPAASETPTAHTAAVDETAISPQEFYSELAERDDVRRILAHLAQAPNVTSS